MKNLYPKFVRYRESYAAMCLVLCFSFLFVNTSFAQCPNDNNFYTDLTPLLLGVPVSNTCIYAGEYATVSVCAGASYTFETCGSSFDTELTLRENVAPFGVLAHNDDACGTQSSITWVATFTGVVRVLVDRFNCGHANACHQLTVTRTTACGTVGGPGDGCLSAIPATCGLTYVNQSTIGNGNTVSNWNCTTLNTPGQDRFYVLTVVDPTTTVVRVTLDNVVDNDTYLEVIQAGMICAGSGCDVLAQYDVGAGTFNGSGLNSFDFPVTGAGTWYFAVDGQGDGVSSYDISFDCLSSGIRFDTSGCAGPPADNDRDGIEVRWNNGPAGPVRHNEVGTLCVTLFITNPSPSGYEWLKRVNFSFGDCWRDVQNLSPDGPPAGNGYYDTAGTWDGTYTPGLNEADFVFTNSSNPVWGDGNAPGMSCAQYTFCMQARVDTTQCDASSEGGLDIVVFAEDDGVGGFGNTQPSSVIILIDQFYLDEPLPIELAAFDAYMDGDMARLEWATASETNNDHFRIERSADGEKFIHMGELPGVGTSRQHNSYAFEDGYPTIGENHYRLVQVDLDGQETVVGQKVLFFAGKGGFKVVNFGPNPAVSEMQLKVGVSAPQTMRMQVRDQTGRLVHAEEATLEQGENTWRVDASKWEAGLYLVRMESQGQQETLRFLKMK